jgi:GNAT superfamily N-acetyltransferase/pyrimidine operon attenuation protein/uracil phosphoribosyltransferase
MNFVEFYSDIAYVYADELESNQIDDAYKMAKKHGISVLSDKEIHTVAISHNQVIGGLWTTWMSGEFSFDVAVRDDYQGQGVGNKLVDIAIDTYEQDKEAFGDEAIMRVDVINPTMEKMLLKKGFEIESKQPGHTMMIKEGITIDERSVRPAVHKDILSAHEYASPRKMELNTKQMRVRDMAYAIKDKNNIDAIKLAAIDMAPLVSRDNILVPIPSSKGDTGANLALAEEIAKISGAEVRDILTNKAPRESNLLRYKSGLRRLEPTKMGLFLKGEVGDARRILFVDNVATSGSSIRAAVNLINGGRGLVFAKVKSLKKKVY